METTKQVNRLSISQAGPRRVHWLGNNGNDQKTCAYLVIIEWKIPFVFHRTFGVID